MKKLELLSAIACLLALLGGSSVWAAQLCSRDSDCDDGVFCNNREKCERRGEHRFCTRNTEPRCPAKVCDETADRCLDIPCMRDVDCTDGIFCNGAERCEPAPNGAICSPAFVPACPPGRICNESGGICEPFCSTDADGDGVSGFSCGGTDCEDADPGRFSGGTEICSPSAPNHDEDCNPQTVGNVDADGDGHVSQICCNFQSFGGLLCGDDCNDQNPGVHSESPEVCDGVDNNCNGEIDEGATVALFADADGDNHGPTFASPVQGCAGTSGFATIANDCDDTNPAIQPGALLCSLVSSTQTFRCTSGGSLAEGSCAAGEVCVVQPNGTGACVRP